MIGTAKPLCKAMISIGCLLLVASGAAVSCSPTQPEATVELYERIVEGNVFDTTPVYGEALPLRLRRTGFEYRCSSCHTDLDSELTSNRPKGEHKSVLDYFDHGSNIYCLSCHHKDDRDSYADDIGQAMPTANSEKLCARCHGLKFRDWQAGIHGRINGHWDESFGPRSKLTCIQCHDPHLPKFPQMVPSRPPVRSRLTDKDISAQDDSAHLVDEEETP